MLEEQLQNQQSMQEEPTENDLRMDIENDFNKIKSERAMIGMGKLKNENSIKDKKIELLKQLYQMLEDNGVNPNDIDSINRFLEKLESINPDLVMMFENALNGLDPSSGDVGINQQGTEGINPQEQGIAQQNELTNRINSPQNNILRM